MWQLVCAVSFLLSSIVLVLAGIELIFFIVASMGLVWVCAENSVDNTGMFWLLLSPALPRAKGFSAPHPTPPARRLGGHKELGGDTAGTADPN